MSWPCFMLTPTQRGRRFRRWIGTEGTPPCPLNKDGYHERWEEASPAIQIDPAILISSANHTRALEFMTCPCGYAFTAPDRMQHWTFRVYATPAGKEVLIDRRRGEIAPGAMWDLSPSWWSDKPLTADGRFLEVMLPDGKTWMIDDDEKDGSGVLRWQRTGVPPQITVTPSILTAGYHGFLTNGMLSDDLEGRTYKEH